MLDVGESVPPFTLRSHDGQSTSLDDLKGDWVVLHAFPFAGVDTHFLRAALTQTGARRLSSSCP